jgi:RNA polymerase-binding transcription factor DksA
LYEVEEAIQRIKLGEYGLCEVTGEPIAAERLEAVPFTRFSLEGQAEYEKKNRRKVARDAGGIFDDNADAPKLESSDDD